MGYLICYWSRYKAALWIEDDGGDDLCTLFGNFELLITEGETCEILEYVPTHNVADTNVGDVSRRTDWWDMRLHELGYPIMRYE